MLSACSSYLGSNPERFCRIEERSIPRPERAGREVGTRQEMSIDPPEPPPEQTVALEEVKELVVLRDAGLGQSGLEPKDLLPMAEVAARKLPNNKGWQRILIRPSSLVTSTSVHLSLYRFHHGFRIRRWL